MSKISEFREGLKNLTPNPKLKIPETESLTIEERVAAAESAIVELAEMVVAHNG